MNKYVELENISEYSTWDIIKKIDRGWSQDDKYYIKNNIGEEWVIRIYMNKECKFSSRT